MIKSFKIKTAIFLVMLIVFSSVFSTAVFAETQNRYIGILGDVNLDEEVNIKDVTEILRFLVKLIELTEDQQILADVNSQQYFYKNNFDLNITDVSDLLKYLTKLPVEAYNIGKVYYSNGIENYQEVAQGKKKEGWQQIVNNSQFTFGEKELIKTQISELFYDKFMSLGLGWGVFINVNNISFQSWGTYPKIDGSTVCVPLANEFSWQHLGLNESETRYFDSFSKTHTAYVNLITKKVINESQVMLGQSSERYYFTQDSINPYGDNGIYTSIITNEQYQFFKANNMFSDYNSLIANNAFGDERPVDIVLAVEPSEEQLKIAKENNVSLYMQPVACDAFVFITDKKNPIDSLTVDQIRKIYTGEITNWKEVGGKDETIVAFQRNDTSGSQTAMESFVMKGAKFSDNKTDVHVATMGGLIEGVSLFQYANDSHSLGYTYKYYLDNQFISDDIKIININGVAPTDENVQSGKYELSTNYYGVVRSNDEDNIGLQFLYWILSDEGQKCVKQAGYIPMRFVN